MAVQKNKKSRSKRDTRRAHDQLSPLTLSVDKESGEKHIRHHISPNGFYRGAKRLANNSEADASTAE